MLGYKASDLIGLHYIDFIHPSEKLGQIDEYKDIRKNGNLSIKNYRIRHKSGSWINFNCTSFISTKENGEKTLVIISDEILKAIHSEQELSRIKLYQDIIFNHLQGMDVYLVDKDMRFLYAAGQEKNKFNFTDDDFIGKTLQEVLPLRTHRALKPLYLEALSGNTMKKEIRFSGQVFELTGSPVRNQNGEILAAVIISKNITREKADRNQLRKAKQEAEAADKAKSLFLASMSHEIRTPLNTIIGFANQLAKTPLTEEQKKYIRLISDSSDQLINVVNELLIIFKIGMGKVFIDESPFSVRNMFDEIRDVFEAETLKKGLSLEFSVSRKVPELVVGDPFRVKQVLTNIVSNSIKYTESGTVRLRCKVPEDKKRKIYLSFSVEDTGIGIPEDELPYIFDEFRQAQNLESKQRSGTGLGLTITKKLVELQKGKIRVRSTLNKGTSFSVVLPFRKSRKHEVQKKPSQYDLTNKLLAGKRLLLVDDDEQNLLLADVLFSEWGLKYDITSDAEDGLEFSRVNKYDVIMLDIHMPKINGLDLMRMIRQDSRNPNSKSKVITITANILQSDLRKYIAGGFNDYILKPFREEELYSKLCHVLELKNQSPEEDLPKKEEQAIDAPVNIEDEYDLSDLMATAKGDITFVNRTVSTFITNTQNSVEVIRKALPAEKWTEIGEAAHKMITAFRYFKCHRIVENLIDLENMALHDHTFTAIPSKVNETIPLIDKMVDNINKQFNFQTI